MKKLTSCFILLFIIYSIQAQTQIIPIEKWKTVNKKNISIMDIVYDSEGNIFTVGDFYTDNENLDFDPGEGVVNLSSLNGSYDVFVTKQDSLGNLLWVKQIGGTDLDRAKKIAISSTGEIYLLGVFWSLDMDFDPGDGEYVLSGSHVFTTPFIIKLTNDGEFVWVKKWRFGYAYFNDMNIDYEGNIYLSGYCTGAVDFDPNNGQVDHTADGYDAFILKINSEGEYIWVNTYSSSSGDNSTVQVNIPSSLEFDTDNNIYYYAYVREANSVDFDLSVNDYIVNTTDFGNPVIIKLSKNGDFIWGNKSNSDWASIPKIKIDKYQNLSICGMFDKSMDLNFEGVPQSLKNTGISKNVCILKLNNSGKVISVKTLPESQADGSTNDVLDYDLDASGNIYFLGSYYGSINFSLNETPHIYNSSTIEYAFNSYVVKYSTDGEFIWFKAFDEHCNGEAFVVDSIFNNILIRGAYSDNNFDNGYLTTFSSLMKIGYCTLPKVPTVTNNTTACIGDELILHATGKGTLGWYTKAIDGKHVATGPDFSVTVAKDTVFYVQDSTCYASATRKAVVVTANECQTTNTFDSSSLTNLKVYPNPTSSKLFIESANIIDKITVSDLMGRMLFETNSVSSIDISDLSNGVYYITIIQDSKANTQKIIKQ